MKYAFKYRIMWRKMFLYSTLNSIETRLAFEIVLPIQNLRYNPSNKTFSFPSNENLISIQTKRRFTEIIFVFHTYVRASRLFSFLMLFSGFKYDLMKPKWAMRIVMSENVFNTKGRKKEFALTHDAQYAFRHSYVVRPE